MGEIKRQTVAKLIFDVILLLGRTPTNGPDRTCCASRMQIQFHIPVVKRA